MSVSPALMTFRSVPLWVVVSLAGAGCGSPTQLPDRCTAQVAAITPGAPILAVGDSLALVASYTGAVECRPNVPATELHWASSDTVTASVDSLGGIVAARHVGQAFISVHAPASSAVLGGAAVRVTAP
jgi:uncharacterized protein YjdB